MLNRNRIDTIFRDVRLKVAEQAFIPKSIKDKFTVKVNSEKATIEIK